MATSCTSSSTYSRAVTLGAKGLTSSAGREVETSPDTDFVGEGQRLGAEPLAEFLARNRRFAVAFSGGCDSAFLLAAAREAGCEVHAYLVKTAFQPEFELVDAHRVADALGVSLSVLEADVLSQNDICANGPDRCRLCKSFIFEAVKAAAAHDGFSLIADGTNASDDPARRPGFLSLAEAGVVSPLRRAAMTKADVRRGLRAAELARGLASGALLSAKPSFPCLAVFVPAGSAIDEESLEEAARCRGIAFGKR